MNYKNFIKMSFKLKIIAFVFVTSILAISSCTKKEEAETINGQITGVVTNFATNEPINRCDVKIENLDKTTKTDTKGQYHFYDITPGTYTVSCTMDGFKRDSLIVTVRTGQVSQANFRLVEKDTKPAGTISGEVIDLETRKPLANCNVKIDQLNLTTTTSEKGEYKFEDITPGVYTISCRKEYYKTVNQSVTIEDKKTTKTNFQMQIGRISGEITDCVMKFVLDKCEVVIEGTNKRTMTSDKGLFTLDSISAGNYTLLCQREGYDDTKVDVTMEEDKDASVWIKMKATAEPTGTWNGKMALAFDDGNGIASDPYIIKTGSQLLLIKEYNDLYFKLANDIDLGEHNWLPYFFSGNLDGNNKTISNLKIERYEDYLGLFGGNLGTIENLTISSVQIKAREYNYIGAVAGYNSGEIKNCKVKLDNNSIIEGESNVGGLVGRTENGSVISNCMVNSSNNKSFTINGKSNVGGLAGSIEKTEVLSNVVSAGVSGVEIVGGIVGSSSSAILKCVYTGNIDVETEGGGIVGSAHSGANVEQCKAEFNITGAKSSIGGIIGFSNMGLEDIIASYSVGTISGHSNATNIGGFVGGGYLGNDCKCYYSYSVVTSELNLFQGDGYGVLCYYCVTPYDKYNNFINYFKELYNSEIDEYWDYSNTWTWKGEVNGSTVSISCPRLKWEK